MSHDEQGHAGHQLSSPPNVNGNANGHLIPDDAALDSPATPVSNLQAPDMKIDYQEQESDVRHEPMPIKPEDALPAKPEPIGDASAVVQTATPADSATNSTPPPPSSGDVKMADHEHILNGVSHTEADVVMHDADINSASSPVLADTSMPTTASNGITTPHPPPTSGPVGEDGPPPAKRPRVHSDVDRSSFTQSATPPPVSTAVSPMPAQPSASLPPPTATTVATATPRSPTTPGAPSTFTTAQLRFCQSTVRSLKKLKDASPFLRPVDPVALNIPHYPSIIKHPMDFATIERKLSSSNPAKPDPNPENPRYHNAEEFIADVRLIFQNCLTFNGPDHAITQMGRRVEEIFDKQIKQLPPALPPPEPKPPAPKKAPTPPPPQPPATAAATAAAAAAAAPPPKKAAPARRLSTTVPVIRRSENEAVGRPKREIHPPPPKDLPYSDLPKKNRKSKKFKDDGTAEQLKFCGKLLQDLHKKQYYNMASPFYEPVDWQKMDLPTYPKVIKRPMDLATMRKKLDAGEYPAAKDFFADFKLMINNCWKFNPSGTPVHQAGVDLNRLFEEKWKNLPPLHEISDSEDEEDSEEERRQTRITEIEEQIDSLQTELAELKNVKPRKKKSKEERREKAPVASTSKAPKPQKSQPKKKTKKPVADDDVLTFEQKKDLSEAISKLEGPKLERVIQIIHEGVPEIRDSTDEIELEIDTLPAPVLTKLYNFVIRTNRPATNKRNRTGKGTGTGGLKRKSMDEDVEAEKIRQLEQRMALFDQGAGGGVSAAMRNMDSDHSSDSSDSDSSMSDSD